MRKKFLAFTALLLVCCGANAKDLVPMDPRPIPSSNGYLTGNDYIRLPEAIRSGYAAGFLTGFGFGLAFERDATNVSALNECIKGIPTDQLMAIVDDYITKHPASRDWNMNALAFNAIHVACVERGTTIQPR